MTIKIDDQKPTTYFFINFPQKITVKYGDSLERSIFLDSPGHYVAAYTAKSEIEVSLCY